MNTIQYIAKAIDEKKGVNILAIDVRGISTLTDYFLIAEGTSDRHVKAIASTVIDVMGKKPLHKEGLSVGDWVVLDYGEIVIHLFVPALREKYQIESIWSKGLMVQLDFNSSRQVM